MFLSLDVGETLAWLFGIPVCSVILVSLFWLLEVIYKKATGRKDREYIPSNKPCLADKTELYLIGYDYIGFIEKNDQKKMVPQACSSQSQQDKGGSCSSFFKHFKTPRGLGDAKKDSG